MTPAFVGTSDEGHAEWSAKGIRGELRWWFRAIAGGELQGDAAKVRELERSVFGGTESDARKDASSALRVMVRVIRADPPIPNAPVHPFALGELDLAQDWKNDSERVRKRLKLTGGRTNPLGYFGYGPVEHRAGIGFVYKRGRIVENSELAMTLQWNREVSAEAKSIFDRALWCWINLGGIGARSRRGYGSLVRTDAGGVVAGLKELKAGITETLAKARAFSPGRLAEWTHFTSEAHVYRSSQPYKNWSEAMKFAGGWMIAFRRRYGIASDERTNIGGRDYRHRDYEWFKSASPARPAAGVPDRAGFGLPLPFGKKVAAGWGPKNEGRRASPLLVHIARFEPGDFYIVFTYIPARLVPDGREIGFMGASSPPTNEQKTIVQHFLNDLKGKTLITEVV